MTIMLDTGIDGLELAKEVKVLAVIAENDELNGNNANALALSAHLTRYQMCATIARNSLCA